MSAILYPVAPNVEQALARPRGRAARESEAAALAAGPVSFVTEPTGPAYPTREAALEAWRGVVEGAGPESRFCALREVFAAAPRRPRARQARAVYREGRRWAPAPPPPPTVWRLLVSYWRIAGDAERAALEQARRARRRSGAQLDAAALRALAVQPLQPVRPQQPLDIGLFEYRPPEAPHIVMPDE